MVVLSWKFNKARIWLDELPDWEFRETQVFELLQETPEKRYTDACSAAIELLLPIGGRAYYGALGAEYVPAPLKQLVIQVPITLDEGSIIHNAIAGRYDTVRAGLPREYLRGVLDGVQNVPETQSLGPGTLRFCRAAHGSLGSSLWFFGVLSSIVIKLLLLERETVSDELLIKLIQAELRNHPIQRRPKD